MKSLKLASIAVSALLLSSAASAADMYIDLGTNSYDAARGVGAPDGDSTTNLFSQFGFSQLLATSVYDFSDGDIFGTFFDTNNLDMLAGLGIPASGTALDGITNVDLDLPECIDTIGGGSGFGAQCDVDALSPLVPPLASDNEGYLQTWDLQMEYTFYGNLTPAGPQFTSGSLKVFFNDLNDDTNDRMVLEMTLNGSFLQPGNLDLFFDITFAETGFLWVDNGSGTFIDAAAGIPGGDFAQVVLDTNVVPPIPTLDQLLLIGDNAIRQTELDGSITVTIPEPASLSILGLGLLGLAAAGRRQRKQAK